jgi:hypothetical protein
LSSFAVGGGSASVFAVAVACAFVLPLPLLFPALSKKASSRPEAALLPPQWRDPRIFAVAFVFAVAFCF